MGIASHYTTIGMLTRTNRRGLPWVWFIAGFDGKQLYQGQFSELQKSVRENHGESVEREVVEAAREIIRVNGV